MASGSIRPAASSGLGRPPVSHQALEQAGKGRQASAHSGSGGAFLLALHPFPGDDGAVIDLAQCGRGRDPEGAHEVLHVEPVGAAGLRTLLLRQPDFFFGDGSERFEWGELPRRLGREGTGGILIQCPPHPSPPQPPPPSPAQLSPKAR